MRVLRAELAGCHHPAIRPLTVILVVSRVVVLKDHRAA
jgi:hypothetical protein